MILSIDQARRVERGERTTIRVPVDPRLDARPLRPASRRSARPFVPKRGELLAVAHAVARHDDATGVSKAGWQTLCHAEVMDVERTRLGRLTDEQAQAEGYETAAEFELAWARRHEPDWFRRQHEQLVDAGTDPEDAEETVELMARNRFPVRWAAREVWVLTIRVEHDLSRFLAPAARPKGDSGYVLGGGDPLDAGSVPPVDELAQRWSRRSARRQLEALSDTAGPEERARRARALGRRVRFLALQDPKLMRQIEELVRSAEREAAV